MFCLSDVLCYLWLAWLHANNTKSKRKKGGNIFHKPEIQEDVACTVLQKAIYILMLKGLVGRNSGFILQFAVVTAHSEV